MGQVLEHTAEQGDCLYDNQCLSNADCTDTAIPVCNDQGGCSNPCDTTDCETNESCSLDESLAPICDCSDSYFRSATELCILENTCVNNADCEEDTPLCDTSTCINPCALASCAPMKQNVVLSGSWPLALVVRVMRATGKFVQILMVVWAGLVPQMSTALTFLHQAQDTPVVPVLMALLGTAKRASQI